MKKDKKAKEPEIIQQIIVTLTTDGKLNFASDPKLGGWAILGLLEIAVGSLKK